jgi:hypothetical protein
MHSQQNGQHLHTVCSLGLAEGKLEKSDGVGMDVGRRLILMAGPQNVPK